MKREDFRAIGSGEEFAELLKTYGLYREDDVTFDELDDGTNYVFVGDDFHIDAEIFETLDLGSILVEGNVTLDFLSIGDVLPDFGVFCVTGNVQCKDMQCCTESTGVSIGGDLTVTNVFYADCGNSVIQVNGDFKAKVLFVAQCSVEVAGEEVSEFDDEVTLSELESIGLPIAGHSKANSAIEAYFNTLRGVGLSRQRPGDDP